MLDYARNIITFSLVVNALEDVPIVAAAIKVINAPTTTSVVALNTRPQMELRNGLPVQWQMVAGVSEKIITKLLTLILMPLLEYKLLPRLRGREKSEKRAKAVLQAIVDHPRRHQ